MKAASDEELRDKLRSLGLRATSPRLAVLKQLLTARAPLTHGEVAEQLAADGLDRATVYRNLIDLAEVGLVRRADIGDHVWRFEVVDQSAEHPASEHPHFICSGCGAVECLPESSVSVRPARGTPRALRKKGIAVQVRGLCDACT
jgi:Fur family ferric uptake transcriptional regulator